MITARWPRSDLGLVGALALAGVLAAAVLPDAIGVLRLLIAGPLVLALPGYALAGAMLQPSELRGPERAALSVALSVVVTIFSALLLDAFGVKLTLWPWIAILAVVTLAAAAVGMRRGHARALRRLNVGPRTGEIAILATAVVLIGAAAAIGFTPLSAPKGTDTTTALSILPTHPVQIAVKSDQTRATRYTVSVSVAGRTVRRYGPFTLAPGQSWTRLVPVAGKPAVVARLAVIGDAAASRSVYLGCWCTRVRSAAKS
ncbi:MAG TPA: DUF1616 domain-containing protein [Solirubrobacteraceae bacterium]|nr:DUF1616 domain-containing protein [Solirubrobacteraceae bacterium]